ncbi:uncharacterized protein DDB_G0287625-like [Sitodiplosis mosellana]|uniref:uncharacterized protein DDB_G0287625-like n=1 Tax=Sitodiplosis mosellana TaxID=263140 RepID=UPI00244464D6|nr:uncharacterized protein DDB_G0287625-like [Sitodiplosis mosellana]
MSNEDGNSGQVAPAAQTASDFIRMAHQMINFRYSGDPLVLDSFIDAIELLKELVSPENRAIFLKFVMTRMEGKARELFTEPPADIDAIITRLKDKIKPDSSKIIEGKILALRADKSSLTKFSEQAEKLAEELNRSLCREGFSQAKAKEITIEKTVEMCRKSSKNDTVKAVLAASSFSEPKEVIAKMIVEINNLKQDKPHSSYSHKFGNQNRNHSNGNGNNRGHSNGNNHNNHNNRNRNGSHNNNNNNNQSNNRQNNYNNGHRSNNNRNGQNQNGNYNNRGSYNQSQGNNQTIRHISGNEMNPGNSGLTMNP